MNRDILIEEVAAAWRPRDPGDGPRSHPAWHDLDPAGREEAFRAAFALRQMEAALDPDGLSTTAKAVLAAIRASG